MSQRGSGLMGLLAVANGAFREAWLVGRLGEHAARQVSTLLLVVLFALYIGVVTRISPIASGRQAVAIGTLWLVLTLAFEFLLGRVAIAPYVFFRIGSPK